jgi:glucokinase
VTCPRPVFARDTAAFEDNGRLRPHVASIPVYVITAPGAGLRGAAVTLAANAQAVDRLS